MIQLILSGKSSSITFQDSEIPQTINFGGQQLLKTHQFIGGQRVLDALGYSDAAIAFSGVFLTASATDRARYLDTLRRTGETVTLAWDVFSYTGILSAFNANYQRHYYVPYSLTFTVQADNTQAVASPPANIQQAVANDAARASGLAGCVGDSGLSSLTSSMFSAVSTALASIAPIARGLESAISSAVNDSLCVIAPVTSSVSAAVSALAPIAAAQARAQVLITTAEQAAIGITTVGGLVPNSAATQIVSNVIAQTNAAVQLPALYEYSSVIGRMQTNMQTLLARGPTTRTIQVGGGNLYQIAANEYGDASLWPIIAAANNLTDPQLTGVQTLKIPPQ